MWIDLQQGILEEFAEMARLSTEDAFNAMWQHGVRNLVQDRKDTSAYRARKKFDPAWVAKENLRKRLWKAANQEKCLSYAKAYKSRAA